MKTKNWLERTYVDRLIADNAYNEALNDVRDAIENFSKYDDVDELVVLYTILPHLKEKRKNA